MVRVHFFLTIFFSLHVFQGEYFLTKEVKWNKRRAEKTPTSSGTKEPPRTNFASSTSPVVALHLDLAGNDGASVVFTPVSHCIQNCGRACVLGDCANERRQCKISSISALPGVWKNLYLTSEMLQVFSSFGFMNLLVS